MHKFADVAAKLVPLKLKKKGGEREQHCIIFMFPYATVGSCTGCYVTLKWAYPKAIDVDFGTNLPTKLVLYILRTDNA